MLISKTRNSFFYFAILPALFFQFIGAYLYYVFFEGTDFVKLMYTFTKVLIVIWPIAWVVIGKLVLPKLREGRDLKDSVFYAMSLGLVTFLLALVIYFWFLDLFVLYAPNIIERVEDWGLTQYYIIFALFVSIIHAFIEEYYWRWFIFRGLTLKFSAVWSAVISSSAFASHHFIILGQFFSPQMAFGLGLFVFLGGLLWAGIYKKTGSLFGCWLSHFLIDLVIFMIGYAIVF
jgi:uncharacterized protein